MKSIFMPIKLFFVVIYIISISIEDTVTVLYCTVSFNVTDINNTYIH